MKINQMTAAILVALCGLSTPVLAADDAAAARNTGASGDNVLNSGKAPSPATSTGASQGDMLSGTANTGAGAASSTNVDANANASAGASASASTGIATFDSDKQVVRQAQEALKAKGQPVKVDGIIGPQTRAAIKSFQKEEGLQATGKLDALTLTGLGVEQSGSTGSSVGSASSK